MTETAYVICCNDRIEKVVMMDPTKAALRKGQLRQAHYDRVLKEGIVKNWTDYKAIYYWHIHEKEAEC